MTINWLAVIAAALSTFVLGGLWYGPLFGKAWMTTAGISEERARGGNKAMIFGGALVLALIASASFAVFLGPTVTLVQGTLYGLTAGLCWVAGSYGISYLFERRSLVHFLVNGGYHTIQFTLIGAILGGWH